MIKMENKNNTSYTLKVILILCQDAIIKEKVSSRNCIYLPYKVCVKLSYNKHFQIQKSNPTFKSLSFILFKISTWYVVVLYAALYLGCLSATLRSLTPLAMFAQLRATVY